MKQSDALKNDREWIEKKIVEIVMKWHEARQSDIAVNPTAFLVGTLDNFCIELAALEKEGEV